MPRKANWEYRLEKEEQEQAMAADPVRALAGKLLDYSGQKEERRAVADEVLQLLEKLSDEDRKSLMKGAEFRKVIESMIEEERPVAAGNRPGEIVGQGIGKQKIDWKWSDLDEFYPDGRLKTVWKEITSPVTEDVTWQGLSCHFEAWQPIRVPEVFVGVLMDSIERRREAQQWAEYMFHKRDTVINPGLMSPEILRVRGSADRGHYLPGGGNIADLDQSADVKRMGGERAES